MDEPAAVDAKIIGAPTASKYTTQMQENSQGQLQRKALSVTSNNRSKVNEGVLAGQKNRKDFCHHAPKYRHCRTCHLNSS